MKDILAQAKNPPVANLNQRVPILRSRSCLGANYNYSNLKFKFTLQNALNSNQMDNKQCPLMNDIARTIEWTYSVERSLCRQLCSI